MERPQIQAIDTTLGLGNQQAVKPGPIRNIQQSAVANFDGIFLGKNGLPKMDTMENVTVKAKAKKMNEGGIVGWLQTNIFDRLKPQAEVNAKVEPKTLIIIGIIAIAVVTIATKGKRRK
jgi:hypothetical protein